VPDSKDDSAAMVDCGRCGRQAAGATGVFYGGALGDEIRAKVCADCWAEWREAEVMVINELRLNFMDPKSQDLLAEQLRQFLMLDPGPDGG
jgi:Fe-S cluster biosynthesis and repair protein YggX